MEKTTDILSIGLDRLDKEQALKAFANGAPVESFRPARRRKSSDARLPTDE